MMMLSDCVSVNKKNRSRNKDATCNKTCKQLAPMPIENHGEQVEVAWTCTTEVRRRMLRRASAAQIQKDNKLSFGEMQAKYT